VEIEDPFLLQLAKAIQAWLWIEGELYSMYSMFMQGANSHLVSVTFNGIQSVDAKLELLNSCYSLVFGRGSEELRAWKALRLKIEKLNKRRNKIVHEPVSIHYKNGRPSEVSIGPSLMNALALVKGQTTHQGNPVVSAEYNPSKVWVLEDHKLTQSDVATLEHTFKDAAREMRVYEANVRPKITATLREAGRERK
jgi:uncharacterized protein with von Willebrand factor type A (vWA) domain